MILVCRWPPHFCRNINHLRSCVWVLFSGEFRAVVGGIRIQSSACVRACLPGVRSFLHTTPTRVRCAQHDCTGRGGAGMHAGMNQTRMTHYCKNVPTGEVVLCSLRHCDGWLVAFDRILVKGAQPNKSDNKVPPLAQHTNCR